MSVFELVTTIVIIISSYIGETSTIHTNSYTKSYLSMIFLIFYNLLTVSAATEVFAEYNKWCSIIVFRLVALMRFVFLAISIGCEFGIGG